MENLTATNTKWILDLAHSELLFKVKHLMISNVKGEFKSFKAEIDGDDFRNSQVSVSIDTASIFTNSDDRDNHLKSADFFDAENHPVITFRSVSFNHVSDENYTLTGHLKIRGVEKEIKLNVEFGGINKDPWGNEKAGFSLNGKISRKDWGLNWNSALETGGVLVSDEVQLLGEVQFLKKV